MIPKIIHYCWFGKSPLPSETERFIAGWKKLNPDYEIIRWDETDFPVDLCNYSREASKSGNWAFVSDVARLYALSKYGGFYLDTDMELLVPLDSLLHEKSFIGQEDLYVGMGIIGAEPGCEWINTFLNYYKSRHFISVWGKPIRTPNPKIFTRYIMPQLAADKTPRIYPHEYFYPKLLCDGKTELTPKTMAVHHYAASWRKKKTLILRIKIIANGLKIRWL